MKFGNRASLEAIPRKYEDVPFPELDTFYRVREMSGAERDIFEAAHMKHTGSEIKVESKRLRSRMLALTLVDESGERMYQDNEVDALADKVGAGVIEKLFEVSQRLSGMGEKAVKDAKKNSDATTSDVSPSDLH